MSDTIPVMELFGPTIQGEGLMSGTISHFLRTGGCGLRCSWCDSMHAVDPELVKLNGLRWTTAQILDNIYALPHAPYITFTGGDPCIYKDLGIIIPSLNVNQIQVAVETQGMEFPWWLDTVDVITFSPKGPSSGNIVDIGDLMHWLAEHAVGKRTFKVCIKVVVFTQEDFDYAMDVYNRIPWVLYDAFYFTAGTPMSMGLMSNPDTRCLRVIQGMSNVAESVLEKAQEVTFNDKVHIGCQQHVLLWPDKDVGV